MDLQQRIELAKAHGWEAVPVKSGGDWWLCNDPHPCEYSGMGSSEEEAFADLLMDDDLWPEIAQKFGVQS